MGLWLGLGYIFQTIGLQTTTRQGGVHYRASVVIVPVLATILLRRPPGRAATRHRRRDRRAGVPLTGRNLRVQSGDLWVLGCAFAFALHIITVARYSPRHDAIRLAQVQIATVAILATAAAFVFETPRLALPADTWARSPSPASWRPRWCSACRSTSSASPRRRTPRCCSVWSRSSPHCSAGGWQMRRLAAGIDRLRADPARHAGSGNGRLHRS